MKTFKTLFESLEILLEDRIDFLKQQFKDKLPTDHDTLAKHKDSDKIVDHFASKADPTTNKAHTQWLLNQYKAQAIRQEDAPGIKSALQDFEKVKGNLEKKDINQYKDIAELRDAVATQKPTVEKKIKEKKSAEDRKGADLEKMYDSDGVTGYKIPNKESSIRHYGPAGDIAQTHWCTAANSEHNMFNSYKGGKYTMHFPNGEVLQFHHQSGQIMSKNDTPIKQGDPRFKDYEHHIDAFIRKTGEDEKGESQLKHKFHIHTPEEIDNELNKADDYWAKNPNGWRIPNEDNIYSIAEKSKLTDEQFKKLKELKTSDGGWKPPVKDSLHSNPNLSHDQAGQLVKELNPANDTDNLNALAKNPAVKGEHLDKIADHIFNGKHYDRSTIANLVSNPNATENHINSAISEAPNNEEIYNNLAQNHQATLTDKHQKALLKRNNGRVNIELAKRSDITPNTVSELAKTGQHNESLLSNGSAEITPEHVESMIKGDPSKAHQIFLSNHPSTASHKDAALDQVIKNIHGGEGSYALEQMVNSRHLTKEHINKLHDEAEKYNVPGKINPFLSAIARSSKASSEDLHRVLDHPDADHASFGIVNNKKSKPEHLIKALDKGIFSSYNKEQLLEHPNTNSQVLHKFYDTGTPLEKMHALHHPAVQMSHFTKALDDGPKLHGAITSSPSAPPSVLKHLSDSPYSFVRKNIAQHKNTDTDTLKKLSTDEDESVAALAKKRIK